LDGGQHAEPDKKVKDRNCDTWLEKERYRVLRFWDNEVLMNIKEDLIVINEFCKEHPPLNPLLSREGKQFKGEHK
jgi:very-short-patch-repair endonuclease